MRGNRQCAKLFKKQVKISACPVDIVHRSNKFYTEQVVVTMRIDAVNRVSQLYQANSTKKVAKQTKTEKYDSVQISQIGMDYQVAKAAVAAAPDVRTDLVNDIKTRMQNGTYDVSMEMLADKLMADSI